ncbi:MAG: alkylation response protein AidB-like acyl-CoA dehydrogenase [Acidimicrobiales bacterium]|jgi:alkylation response protein AidB-like acyl-CoA dehydrogenase
MASDSPTIDEFRRRSADFICDAKVDGIACRAFGAIMPPAMHDQAKAWQQHMYANGFAGVSWPKEYGGQGYSPKFRLAWSEECARAEVSPYMNFQGFVLAGGAILKYGTEEQKQKYLRATLAAEIVWCQLFSEPGSGSDLVSLSTKAEDHGDEWQVTGQKVWSSTAQLADHGILLARTNFQEPGHRGISFFLFDMHGPGIDVRPLKQMTGDHEFCEVFLDDAPVAKADLLGPLHGGWGVATSVLGDERAEVGAAGIGLERATQRLIDTIDDSTDPVHRDRIMRTRVTAGALRQLLDRSEGDPKLGPLVKLGNTEFSTERTRTRLDGMGPAATVLADEQVVEDFLYAPGMRVAGGTSEIQRNLIGERLLGLPREPKAR